MIKRKPEEDLKWADLVVVVLFPPQHSIFKSKPAIASLELAYQMHPKANWLAITGTNGKTTTTTLLVKWLNYKIQREVLLLAISVFQLVPYLIIF